MYSFKQNRIRKFVSFALFWISKGLYQGWSEDLSKSGVGRGWRSVDLINLGEKKNNNKKKTKKKKKKKKKKQQTNTMT